MGDHALGTCDLEDTGGPLGMDDTGSVAVLLSFHHHQGFLLQVFLLQKIWVLMIVLQDTIHATPAWRSTGLPTSSIGAARRKARDVRATHHCTCRQVAIEHAQGSPYLPVCSDW